MRAILVPAAVAIAVTALSFSATPAPAKGCLKGAAVGGVAGHFAGHHGLLGAGAGCIIGHHEANKHARERNRAYRDGSADHEGYGSSGPTYDRGYGPR
jgi:hypothetical protein